MFMCVKFNSIFDSEMNVYYVTQVLKQSIKIKTMCPNYILEVRNTKSHLLQVNLLFSSDLCCILPVFQGM